MDKDTRCVTKKDLEVSLDERFTQFAKVITDAISEQMLDLKRELKADIKSLDQRISRQERKLDAALDRIDSHEGRLVKLEHKTRG